MAASPAGIPSPSTVRRTRFGADRRDGPADRSARWPTALEAAGFPDNYEIAWN